MIYVYIFSDASTCVARHELQSQAEFDGLIGFSKPALYATSSQAIDIRLAQLVNGSVQVGDLTRGQMVGEIRAKRNTLLQASDWTQLPDAPAANKEAWASYRQALRDVTSQSDPFNITWPVAPV